jgi:ankyrin repeat protein
MVVPTRNGRFGKLLFRNLGTALHAAENENTLKLLLQHENIDVNVKDNSGNTPLHYFSNKETTELLLNHENIDVNAKDNDGRLVLNPR